MHPYCAQFFASLAREHERLQVQNLTDFPQTKLDNEINFPFLLRTFARNFCNIDFFLKLLPLKDDELAMSEM